jgi:hypothetical protein
MNTIKRIIGIVLLTVGLPYAVYMLVLRKKLGLKPESKHSKIVRKAKNGVKGIGSILHEFTDGFHEER